jgi:hypothetical protein
MIDWEDIRHFLAVAQSGTLSGAARSLKVDPRDGQPAACRTRGLT